MAGFLAAQLDYVYFVYGLALVLLGAVSASISRDDPGRLPWGWLAAFGVLHGVGEWLHVLAMTDAAGPWIHVAITLLLFGSYLLLLEFARRSQGLVTGRRIGPWVTGLVALAPVAVAAARGLRDLDPSMRFLVALPSTLWAAAVIAATGRQRAGGADAGSSSLAAAAAFLAFYGVLAGVVVPDGAIVPDGWPTRERWLATTGFPVQVLRGAACAGAALALWSHACSLDDRGRVVRKRWRFFWATALALLVVVGAGWYATDQVGRIHDRDLAAEVESNAAQIQDHLAMEMQAARDGARALSRILARLDLARGQDLAPSPLVDEVVDAIAGPEGDRVAYVLDRDGRTIAASNRDRKDSFLGRRYADRPYFADGLAGNPGRFMGVGRTSGVPGFYASEPIPGPSGAVAGVAVVKSALSPGSFGPFGGALPFLVSGDGTIVIAGQEGVVESPMWAAPGDGAVPGDGRAAPTLPAADSWNGKVRVGGSPYQATRLVLPGTGWSVVVLLRETMRAENRGLGILITLLLALVLVGAFVLLQRQLGAESAQERRRREAEVRAREASRRADTDALTGIPNRQSFDDALSREFARARRFRQPLSVILVDLDHFKRVNDAYGHAAGDQVLTGAARLLESRVRESDLAARWGGEEFAIIASMTDAAGAVRLAEKLRGMLEVTHMGPPVRVTASFGVAELRPDDGVGDLLRRADEALYRAKQEGRNRVACAESWVDMDVVALAEAQREDGGPAGRARVYMDTGYAPIDAEHRALSTGLGQLIDRVNAGTPDEVGPALAAVVRAVGSHFAHEESLMREHGYPDRARHEEAHLLFAGDVKRFQAELGRHGVSEDFRRWAVSRLPEWFRYHILAHDVALGKFLLDATPAPSGAGRKDGVHA